MNSEMNQDAALQSSTSQGWETTLPPSDLPQESQLAAAVPNENDFTFHVNNDFPLNGEGFDPNLGILINKMSFDLMENMPLDLLLNEGVK